MPNDPRTDCPDHSGLCVRITRNEQDVQTLYSKVGESIGLLHRIDKRLEGLHTKIALIAAGITAGVSLVLRVIPWDRLF